MSRLGLGYLSLESAGEGGVVDAVGVLCRLLVLAIGISELSLEVVDLLALFFERTLSIVTALLEGRGCGRTSFFYFHHAFHGGSKHVALMADSFVDMLRYGHHKISVFK